MKVQVFDTRVTTETGDYIHFDVLVNDANAERVKDYALDYLKSLGVVAADIRQAACNFCHSELANPETRQRIVNNGHQIIRL